MSMYRNGSTLIFLVSVCLNLLLTNSTLAETRQQSVGSLKDIQFGVLPFLSPARLESIYALVAADFSRMLNTRVYFKTSTTSAEYFKQLEKQVYDIAIVNPFDSIPVIDQFNYVPLTARPMHRCIIVTPENSAIDDIEKLRGKVVGLASKRSPISFYSLRAIEDHGLNAGKDFTVKYHKTTHACLHNLVIGGIDACGAGGATSSVFRDNRKVKLRKIGQCDKFPGMVIVAHSRIPQQQREKLKNLILGWTKSGNNALLKKLGKHAKYVPYNDNDYKMIRRHHRQWQQTSYDSH